MAAVRAPSFATPLPLLLVPHAALEVEQQHDDALLCKEHVRMAARVREAQSGAEAAVLVERAATLTAAASLTRPPLWGSWARKSAVQSSQPPQMVRGQWAPMPQQAQAHAQALEGQQQWARHRCPATDDCGPPSCEWTR